jgi:hypothetical protein
MHKSFALAIGCVTIIEMSFGASGCGAPGRQTPEGRAPQLAEPPDSEAPSLAWIQGLVGQCPHPVDPKPECSELKAKAIRVCNEHQANPCMEAAIQFGDKAAIQRFRPV